MSEYSQKSNSHFLVLVALSLLQTPPDQLIYLAAKVGFDFIGLRVRKDTDVGQAYELSPDSLIQCRPLAAGDVTGIEVIAAEFLLIDGSDQREQWLPALEAAAALGGKAFTVAAADPDHERLCDLRNGSLVKGRTCGDSARKRGIGPRQLTATVREFNDNARQGSDAEFGRSATELNRYGGDQKLSPNPSLAPLEKDPFYAVKVVPGSFGTFAGIAADHRARVLREDGSAIGGFYGVGNDRASILGGYYPAGGINLGPALTFGYIAGNEVSEYPSYTAEQAATDQVRTR